MTRIDTVSAREKLAPRREPYWLRVTTGCYLGYRRMTSTSEGTWIARAVDTATGKKPTKPLGDFSELANHQRFGAAKADAESWFKHLGAGGTADVVTVKQACANYVTHIRESAGRGDVPADDLEGRFRRWVDDDKALAGIELGKLTRAKVETWRKRLAATPVQVNRDDRDEPVTRPRAPASLNRDMAALRAALNHALDAGHATSDQAWRVALRPIENADRRRETYLDRKQRRALVNAAAPDLALFLRGLSLLPLRPGALAQLKAGNYDRRLQVLKVGADKHGQDRKLKLSADTAAFFDEAAKDKLPGAPLLSRADGMPWNKDSWKHPVRAAVMAAELPDNVSAYVLRHSVITDLVHDNLDLLTVAQISGTSVAMIEKHYGHLRGDVASLALARLAL